MEFKIEGRKVVVEDVSTNSTPDLRVTVSGKTWPFTFRTVESAYSFALAQTYNSKGQTTPWHNAKSLAARMAQDLRS